MGCDGGEAANYDVEATSTSAILPTPGAGHLTPTDVDISDRASHSLHANAANLGDSSSAIDDSSNTQSTTECSTSATNLRRTASVDDLLNGATLWRNVEEARFTNNPSLNCLHSSIVSM